MGQAAQERQPDAREDERGEMSVVEALRGRALADGERARFTTPCKEWLAI